MTISRSKMHQGKNHRKILLKRKEDSRRSASPAFQQTPRWDAHLHVLSHENPKTLLRTIPQVIIEHRLRLEREIPDGWVSFPSRSISWNVRHEKHPLDQTETRGVMVQGRHCMSLSFLFCVSATMHFLCLIHRPPSFPNSFLLPSIFFHDCMPLICSLWFQYGLWNARWSKHAKRNNSPNPTSPLSYFWPWIFSYRSWLICLG
jgi:hypothetical protein